MNGTLRVLAAGDHFVLPSLITSAVGQELRDHQCDVDVRELTLGWPLEPFGPVAEVTEASDAEDELIEALSYDREVLVTQMAPVTERVLDASPPSAWSSSAAAARSTSTWKRPSPVTYGCVSHPAATPPPPPSSPSP